MKDYLEIRKFDGESARIANEDKPDYLFQKIENLRPSVKAGSAIKRDPYTTKYESGTLSLQTMKEFKDKNGTATLAVIGGDEFKIKINSGGTYATGSFTDNNDGTIDGDNAELASFNNELRAGVGTRTAGNGDKPLWYGYIESASRYKDAATISADEYLEEQFPEPTAFIFDIGQTTTSLTTQYVPQGSYRLYASVLLDGYQKKIVPLSYLTDSTDIDTDDKTIYGIVTILDSDISDLSKVSPRITAIDIFIGYYSGKGMQALKDEYDDNMPGYYLEQIELGSAGDFFLEKTGTLDYANQKITIASYADWQTFNPQHYYLRDDDNDKDYHIASAAVVGSDVELTLDTTNGDAIASADDGETPSLKFYSNWYSTTYAGANCKSYKFFYDGYYKSYSTDMYTYLNMPVGDLGLTDYKYKYLAWNGNHALYGGGSDPGHTYYSVVNSPDVIPSLNINRHKANVRGLTNVGQDFLVFTDIGIERIRIAGNQSSYQDEDYLNAILVSNRAKVKIDDDTVAFMSYNGPILIEGRNVNTGIGWHLREWWLDTFSQSELEACVVGYNFKEEEIWFSFPTYSTSPYTNGIIFVFDMKAYKQEYISPWWRIKTDIAVKAFTVNTQFNLIGADETKVVDFNTAGTDETVSTALKLKVLENPKISGKVRFDRLYLDKDGSDTVTPACYFDGSSSAAISPTFNSDECAFMRYVAKTVEVEMTTSASTNDLELKKIQLSYKPFRK